MREHSYDLTIPLSDGKYLRESLRIEKDGASSHTAHFASGAEGIGFEVENRTATTVVLRDSAGMRRAFSITRLEGNGYLVQSATGELRIELEPSRPEYLKHLRSADTGTKEGQATRVLSSMPGRIVRICVALGEQVEAKQPLVVIEAMKMQNEIRNERAGTVSRVCVQEGQSVERSSVLLEVT